MIAASLRTQENTSITSALLSSKAQQPQAQKKLKNEDEDHSRHCQPAPQLISLHTASDDSPLSITVLLFEVILRVYPSENSVSLRSFTKQFFLWCHLIRRSSKEGLLAMKARLARPCFHNYAWNTV